MKKFKKILSLTAVALMVMTMVNVNYLSVFATEETTASVEPIVTVEDSSATANSSMVQNSEFQLDKLTAIDIKTAPKLIYKEGEKVDLDQLVAVLSDSNGNKKEVKYQEFSQYNGLKTDPEKEYIMHENSSQRGVVVFFVSNKSQIRSKPTGKFTVVRYEKDKLSEIKIAKQPKLAYIIGEQLSLLGLQIQLIDSDGAKRLITDYTFFEQEGIAANPAHGTVLKAEHNAKTIVIASNKDSTIQVETNPLKVDSFDKEDIRNIKIVKAPKLHYVEEQNLNLAGLKVELTDTKSNMVEVVYADFTKFGLTTNHTHEKRLMLSDHNSPLKITKGNIEASAGNLTVVSKDSIKIQKIFERDLELLFGDGTINSPRTGRLANVPSDKATITQNDVQFIGAKAVKFYNNESFEGEGQDSLALNGSAKQTDVYIKLLSNDSSIQLYYKVPITQVQPSQPQPQPQPPAKGSIGRSSGGSAQSSVRPGSAKTESGKEQANKAVEQKDVKKANEQKDKQKTEMLPEIKPDSKVSTKLTIGDMKYTVVVDGQAVERTMDVAPMVHMGRTVLPARMISEILGVEVKYEPATRTANFMYGEEKVQLTLGQKFMLVNGKSMPLTADILNVNGRILLPLTDIQKAFAELGLKAKVDWDADTKSVTVDK